MMTYDLQDLLRTAVVMSLALTSLSHAQDSLADGDQYSIQHDVPYRVDAAQTEYMRRRCRLDVYHPTKKKDFSTIVWFHGGGLTAGNRIIPDALRERNVAVVSVNYRLSPQVKSPAWIEDAAAAVAWTFRNIERFGGSAEHIFVSGHSAGGYLTSMVGLDKRWLASHDIDANRIAGLIPYSGHTITHFTVRAERGIPGEQAVIDDLAPLYHVRRDAPPLLLITGDREMEMLGRYEENAYMWRMMQVIGHSDTELFELEGYNHGQMAQPAHPLLLKFVRAHSSQ
jgi:acetyl esterase/lipase